MARPRRAPSSNRIWAAAAALLVSIVLGVVFQIAGPEEPTDHSSQSSPAVGGDGWGDSVPTRDQILKRLRRVSVVPARPDVPGYDRECGTAHACSFGQPWSDDTDAPLGRDGCDTRNGMLARALTEITVRPGTDGCVVIAGSLHDPYTGRRIEFAKERASAVQVDHLIPLSLAWDLGAGSWPQDRRTRFANDPLNLVVVDGSANASKGDRGPGEWMPINAAYRCTYVQRYLEVALAYEIPLAATDVEAVRFTAGTCPVA